MTTRGDASSSDETTVTVRYWAGARAAAGVAEESVAVPGAGPVTLADVVRRVLEVHPDDRMAQVVGVCSVLVGEDPVGRRDHAEVVLSGGESVEFLPPFAGG